MKEKVRGSNNSLCNYFRKCHINVPNYASTSVIKASSNNKISRCLGNFDEILNERPSEDISTPGNSSGVYFKLDDNNQGGEMKHFFNVEGQLTDMIDSSEELHQNDHSPEVIEEAYDSNEESKENMDNYYNFKEPTETLEESEMDVSTRDFMDPTLDIQNNFYHTKKYGEDPTILSENEKEKLKEYISSLRMKCSDLRNELSEDEVNELIFHLDDNSSVDDLRNLWWQLRCTERVYYISVINELKRFYEFLIKYFKLKEDKNTKGIWGMINFDKILEDLVDKEKYYNKKFYMIIKSNSKIIDEFKNLIDESRESFMEKRTEILDFYRSKFIKEMKNEYYQQNKSNSISMPLETDDDIIQFYNESSKRIITRIVNMAVKVLSRY